MHVAGGLVAIEHRRIDLARQRGAQKQRIAFERSEDDGSELASNRRVLRDLQIALYLRTLMPGGRAPVDPRVSGAVEPGPNCRDLRGTQALGTPTSMRVGPLLQMNL